MKGNLKATQTAKNAQSSHSATGHLSRKQGDIPSSGSSTHAPSVPISVYRDLANELSTANHHVNRLTTQNEALWQQNQSLRAEIERVIESATKLQRLLKQTPHSAATITTSNLAGNVNKVGVAQLVSQHGILASNSQKTADQVPVISVPDQVMAELDETLVAQIGPLLLSTPGAEPGDIDSPSINTSQPIKVYGPYCNLPVQERCESDSDTLDGTQSSNRPLNRQVLETQFLTEQTVETLTSVDPTLGGDMDNGRVKPINGLWLTLTLVVVIATAFSAGFLVVLPFIQVDGDS